MGLEGDDRTIDSGKPTDSNKSTGLTNFDAGDTSSSSSSSKGGFTSVSDAPSTPTSSPSSSPATTADSFFTSIVDSSLQSPEWGREVQPEVTQQQNPFITPEVRNPTVVRDQWNTAAD